MVVIEVALITEADWVQHGRPGLGGQNPPGDYFETAPGAGLSESEALARMASQTPAEEKVKLRTGNY